MVKLKCNSCKYTWTYFGKRKFSNKHAVYVCCPTCHSSVKLEEYYPERICFICGDKFKTEDMRKIKVNKKIKKYVCDLCFEKTMED